ncbi:hypothetical protein F511_26541 [Dorcoceras hygrometricum]|uniref:Uncharacterized protein n=1 Tax=Dorcoceras hygrometricum TaxID=472368 RepID=A0A2Z7CUH7_9LAMI|nr:hypothetical protein F511_26541 [Dorcoceras hygrometricum]
MIAHCLRNRSTIVLRAAQHHCADGQQIVRRSCGTAAPIDRRSGAAVRARSRIIVQPSTASIARRRAPSHAHACAAASGGGWAVSLIFRSTPNLQFNVRYNKAIHIDQIRETLALIPLLGIRIRPPARQRKNKKQIAVDYRQSGPRPDPRLLRQAALEALTRSARTNTPRKTRPERFPAKLAAAAGGGGRRTAAATCVTLNGSGIQLAVGPQPLWLRNHNSGPAQRIMVKRLATSPHDPLGITDSACKNQSVVVSVQYGPFNPYIPIRSTTIGKSRVARDPTAMHTSWRSNSDIASVISIGYPRMSASGESSTMMHRLLHASGSHPIPTPYDSKTNRYNQDLGLIHSTNGNHLESPNDGSSIDHQVTIYLHAQNITMFPTNETWYIADEKTDLILEALSLAGNSDVTMETLLLTGKTDLAEEKIYRQL